MLLINDIYYTDRLYLERHVDGKVEQSVAPDFVDKEHIALRLGMTVEENIDHITEEGELMIVKTIDEQPIDEFEFDKTELLQFYYETVVDALTQAKAVYVPVAGDVFKEIRKWN